MAILLLSRSENLHANAIEESLCQKGQESLRINVDKISTETDIVSFDLDNNCWSTHLNGVPINYETYSGVFVHHPRISVSEEVGKDELDRSLVRASWFNVLDSLEFSLPHSVWINKPSIFRNSANPFKQLISAQSHGMRTPDTCFTNKLEMVHDFAENHSQIMLKTGPLSGIHMDKQRILGRIINPDTLSQDALIGSPCFFQEYIPKDFELRVHVVGERVMSCRIDSQASEVTRTDWRNYDIANTPHHPYELNDDIAHKCIEITRDLGLELGILDLIRTPEGETVFLECNSQGHWIWIEKLTGLPITDSITEHLLKSTF